MLIKILGAAAGGGFPQWNCNCRQCQAARVGRDQHGQPVRQLLQSSIAISANNHQWVVVNASPDLRQQINQSPFLNPAIEGGRRSSPIAAVVVTNADVDHIAGLLNLREGQPFSLYASEQTHRILESNPIFECLNKEVVRRRILEKEKVTPLLNAHGQDLGLEVSSFGIAGKTPLYLENTAQQIDHTVGLLIKDQASTLGYVPGCGKITDSLIAKVDDLDCLLFDGTFYSEDEMPNQHLGHKSAADMAHIPIASKMGPLERLQSIHTPRKVFIHINNSNPILTSSPERKNVEMRGWEIAQDGMSLELAGVGKAELQK